jgi:hypothetical protein
MADDLEVTPESLARHGINLYRLTEISTNILSQLKSTISTQGQVTGSDKTSKTYLETYTPAANAGFLLLEGVNDAVTNASDQVVSNAKGFLNTDDVNTDATRPLRK